MIILAPRRAGMTHPEFRRYVTDVHGPPVKSVTEVATDIRHYHCNFPAETRYCSAPTVSAVSRCRTTRWQ